MRTKERALPMPVEKSENENMKKDISGVEFCAHRNASFPSDITESQKWSKTRHCPYNSVISFHHP